MCCEQACFLKAPPLRDNLKYIINSLGKHFFYLLNKRYAIRNHCILRLFWWTYYEQVHCCYVLRGLSMKRSLWGNIPHCLLNLHFQDTQGIVKVTQARYQQSFTELFLLRIPTILTPLPRHSYKKVTTQNSLWSCIFYFILDSSGLVCITLKNELCVCVFLFIILLWILYTLFSSIMDQVLCSLTWVLSDHALLDLIVLAQLWSPTILQNL